jgi:hypothetical protein
MAKSELLTLNSGMIANHSALIRIIAANKPSKANSVHNTLLQRKIRLTFFPTAERKNAAKHHN